MQKTKHLNFTIFYGTLKGLISQRNPLGKYLEIEVPNARQMHCLHVEGTHNRNESKVIDDLSKAMQELPGVLKAPRDSRHKSYQDNTKEFSLYEPLESIIYKSDKSSRQHLLQFRPEGTEQKRHESTKTLFFSLGGIIVLFVDGMTTV